MKIVKMVSIATLVAVVASVLGGCIVETRRPHHYDGHRVVVVPVRR